MEINIRVEGIENIAKNLQAIPGALKFTVSNAIKVALNSARTTADREIRARYGVRQQAVLADIGKPYVSGLMGIVRAQGQRLKAPQDFIGIRDEDPAGVVAPWVKNKPVTYPHAWMNDPAKGIMERADATGRYPLKFVDPPYSVPELLEQQKDIQPKIEAKIRDVLYGTPGEMGELDRLMNFVLSTGQVPKSRWTR